MSIQNNPQPVSPAPVGDSRTAPFFEQRGPIGVLLIHGYSGSPDELRGMGAHLADAGYTIHGPQLAGHSGAPDDMFGVCWEDWLASAATGLRLLREHCRTVFVCGFSLGGLLALHLAAHEPIGGLILLAPALRLRGGSLLRTTGLLRHILPWYYPLAHADFASPAVRAAVFERAPEADLDDPAVVKQIRRTAKVPIGSLYELARLQRRVRSELARVDVPTLIMQGRNDQTVNPHSAIEVAAGIRARDQRLVWFERSGHQLPREIEREAVWATACEWLNAHT
ncbi:MAG: alpha/beta fold hydrolase [Roseiflexaceae bacterium]